MSRKIGLFLALGFCGLLATAQQGSRPELHPKREDASDLEVTGLLKGVPPGESRFVSRRFLVALPQTAATIEVGVDFGDKPGTGLEVTGIYLDVLARSLGAKDAAIAMAAICNDGYTSTFPAEYIQRHRPIFVLSIDGLTPHDWAVKNHGFDAGPYFIGYQAFAPSFQVLAHVDRPQQPDGLKKIVFETEGRLLGGIMPKKVAGSNRQAEMDGYRIARQNCYRCHNAGGYGGTKAAVTWSTIGSIAKNRPEYFAAWVRDPQSIKVKSAMPPNKDYDKATLMALQRYFATFAMAGQ